MPAKVLALYMKMEKTKVLKRLCTQGFQIVNMFWYSLFFMFLCCVTQYIRFYKKFDYRYFRAPVLPPVPSIFGLVKCLDPKYVIFVKLTDLKVGSIETLQLTGPN